MDGLTVFPDSEEARHGRRHAVIARVAVQGPQQLHDLRLGQRAHVPLLHEVLEGDLRQRGAGPARPIVLVVALELARQQRQQQRARPQQRPQHHRGLGLSHKQGREVAQELAQIVLQQQPRGSGCPC